MPIELNIDLGELDDEPEALFALATTVSLACGGHAGDQGSMQRALDRAQRAGARVLAHPSYPDRAGFGRTSMPMTTDALAASVHAQCASLRSIAQRAGVEVRGLKLHGALYHDAARSPELAAALIDAASRALIDSPAVPHPDALVVVGPPHGALHDVARSRSLRYEREGFADRGYLPDGSLVPRSEPGSVLVDPGAAAEQAVVLARAGMADTLCVHGDNPAALAVAQAVRTRLESEGLLTPHRAHEAAATSTGPTSRPPSARRR